MVKDRYYLTKNCEKLLQKWYNNDNIKQVNEQIDQVLLCIQKIKKEWNEMQKELFNILINEL